jgi:CelD/BcsL family acetyltransferase involved in cellulose biosynthesis
MQLRRRSYPHRGLRPGLATVTSVDVGDLDLLAEGWRSLGAAVGGPVEQFEWAATCAATTPCDELRIAAVSRHGRLVAVSPFAVKRARGVRRRIMLGVDVYREPMDLMASDPDALDELARTLARDRLPLELGRLPADSPTLPALRRAFAGRRIVVTRALPTSPYIALDRSWEEPEAHLNSGRRSDLRRARRRAERMGEVHAEILAPAPYELEALLQEAFEIEARSWKLDAGSAILCLPVEEAFFRHYSALASRDGTLRLCFLRVGDRRVAMQIAVVAAGSFWLVKIGYDAEYARCSPGVLLLRDSIAYAAGQGLRTFEFLGENEPWIAQWARTEHPTVGLHAYPLSPLGGAALAADASYAVAQQARQRMRQVLPPLREALKRRAAPAISRVARRYVAGESVDDALRVMDRLGARGTAATVGFWDGPADTPRRVADRYLEAIDALGARGGDCYVSVKLPALDFSLDLFGEVVARAGGAGVRVHLDSLAPEAAGDTRAAVEEVLAGSPDAPLGYTLPGRWLRSMDDADWASSRGLPVRVVKGEWADRAVPDRDLRQGYLEVIDRLCGRTAHVAVATHDTRLAAEAIARLREADTPCGLELLYGLPVRQSLEQARRLEVGARVYVPYGRAYMPYALSQLRKSPRTVLWLARDLAAPAMSRGTAL